MKRPDYVTDAQLDYLDALRESGVTNMYGAGEYLIAAGYCEEKRIARNILGYWMETFGKEDR